MFLSFNNVKFIYEGSAEPVLVDLRFTVPSGWTGVVGANGAGKSTLLRLAVGELRPTQGQVMAPGLGSYCPQRTDELPSGLEALLEAEDSDAQRLRGKLGLQPDWGRRWPSLSHGERKRAQIAVLLHQDPVFLAVDEPTNHLDRETRALVREALASFRGLGLLVSHDRELLDDLCAQCLFLEPSGPVLRPGGYSEGAGQAERERTALLRQRVKAGHEVDRLQREMQVRRDQTAKGERQRSKRGLAKGDVDAKAKVDAARVTDSGSGQRMRQLEGRLEQASERKAGLDVRRRFAQGITLGGVRTARKHLLALPEGELPLGPGKSLWIPALVIAPGDRIGIRGPNGAGKSTLIRHIVAGLETAGETYAYIPQELDSEAARSILDGFRQLPPQRLGRAMTLVRRLGSDPARLLQSLDPSPGELRKLLLAQCIERDPHVVILDEPTNHLDLPSLECLEAALEGFAAALVMVSHDQSFLGKLARRLWTLRPGRGGRWELFD